MAGVDVGPRAELEAPALAPVEVVAVPGTWGWSGECFEDLLSRPAAARPWWVPGSAWWARLEPRGCVPLNPRRPFVWTTDLDGVPRWLEWFGLGASGRDWHAAAYAFADHVDRFPKRRRRIVSHSHGGAVVALAVAEGLELEAWISAMMPIRGDLERRGVYAAAASRCDRWLNVYSDWSDRWQVYGGVFDGALRIRRRLDLAGVEDHGIAGVGHSGIFTDPEGMAAWETAGLIAWLRGAEDVAAA